MSEPAKPSLTIDVDFVMAVDPGNEKSGWVVYAIRSKLVEAHGHADNDVVLRMICAMEARTVLVIEAMTNQGKRVGVETFDACWWGGRFEQAAHEQGTHVEKLTRAKAKGHIIKLCGGNDAEVKRALVKLFGAVLKSWTSHELAALAVARTFAETRLPAIPFHD